MILGTVASTPHGSTIVVSPAAMIENFRPGMVLQFRSPGGHVRAGTAKVAEVGDGAGGLINQLSFATNLNAQVCAVAEGDEIIEYEVPCTRCRCRSCNIRAMF